jgi:hypothetical protein
MTVLISSITESGMFYVPKHVRDCVGQKTNIITNACAAVMYPANIEFEDVITSLEIIKADLQHRISLRDKGVRGVEN